MYLALQQRLSERIRSVLATEYGLELSTIAMEQPPELKFGEFATPVAFELAKKLRKAPRMIAAELCEKLAPVEGFSSFEAAGAGYINAHLDRAWAAGAIAADRKQAALSEGVHSLVEHTSINPNKAAHIGHLRNAILGDTFVRLLRAAGQRVDVQNYIDNTGVQVADVVVGLVALRKLKASDVRGLVAKLTGEGVRIDYFCWDLYAEVSQWYTAGSEKENRQRKQLRLDTLHRLEKGEGDEAEIAEIISTAVLRRHLETMLRLGIEYDFLPRESEILHLNFWAVAFELMKKTGVLYEETAGKNKGCWVMKRPGAEEIAEGPDEDAKVIVRSNGTVTYVGKDIAYHLWKFGLLEGRDFGYKPFFTYPNHECWISAETGEQIHPHFGGAQAIYNVIDARQSDPQSNVIEALRGMGHTEQAARYTHFSYEMVALTPRCAMDLGYVVSREDQARAYLEVSGRKGFGVKADDLMDKLIAASFAETSQRHPELSEPEQRKIAEQIGLGALRYFMLKFTRNTVLAFDFKDALSFEGETGPYIQYAVVRARNIFRKAGTTPEAVLAGFNVAGVDSLLSEEDSTDVWALLLRAAKRRLVLDQCITTSEPAHLAKHAFQLAQEFNNFYHRHHILTEEDAAKKQLLLATAAVALRELILALSWLGIDSPEVM